MLLNQLVNLSLEAQTVDLKNVDMLSKGFESLCAASTDFDAAVAEKKATILTDMGNLKSAIQNLAASIQTTQISDIQDKAFTLSSLSSVVTNHLAFIEDKLGVIKIRLGAEEYSELLIEASNSLEELQKRLANILFV